MKSKLYLGPMSKNIVDAAIELSNESDMCVGFCASRRQIEFNGGYVNGWITKSFTNYVRGKANNSILVRDHGGPGQGQENDDGIESFKYDALYFDIIHIDPWKKFKSIEEEVVKTSEYIDLCNSINPYCKFEVGTEQSICELSSEELFSFLNGLKRRLGQTLFNKIIYVVIQSGTSLEEDTNTGKYDSVKLKRMIDVCKGFSVLSKEHNGDYLSSDLIKEKFSLGLDSINIAPEFGVIETLCVLDRIDNEDLLIKLHSMCIESGKWKKWVNDDFDPNKNKRRLIKICGHYIFSEPRFKSLIKNKIFDGIDDEIKSKVKTRIKNILGD
jgi:hypothetical protein